MRFINTTLPFTLLMTLACGGSGGTTATDSGSASSTTGGGGESTTGGEPSTGAPTTGGSESQSGTGTTSADPSTTSAAETTSSSTTSPVDETTGGSTGDGTTGGSTGGDETTGGESTSSDDTTSGGGEIKDCNSWQAAFQAEVLEIRGCTMDNECGVEMPGTSCGCTRNWVARLDADLEEFDALVEKANELGCELPFISTCDCPQTNGFECNNGICSWNYT